MAVGESSLVGYSFDNNRGNLMALCTNCGFDKGEGSYCGGCGQRTSQQPQYQQPPQYQPPQYQQPQYQQPQYQQPQFQQPQYQHAQYQPPQYQQAAGSNSLAIASLVASLISLLVLPIILAPVGIICGHVALSQINRTNQGGRGKATAGLIVGYISLLYGVVVVMGSSGY